MIQSVIRRSRINRLGFASARTNPCKQHGKIRKRSFLDWRPLASQQVPISVPFQAVSTQQYRFLSNKNSNNNALFTKQNLADGPPLTLGTGKLANLTKASIVAAMGDTVVLTTVATGDEEHNNNNSSFANMTVDYRQRLHGVGKIPISSASRRDNAQSTPLEILGSRAIDRALRPLLLPNLKHNIHIHSSVQGCSAKGGNPIVASINSASAALMSQELLQEPVAAVSLGVVAGGPKVLVNPSNLPTPGKESNSEQIGRA